MRLLTMGLLGVAVLRLSDRLGAGRRRRRARRRRAQRRRWPACSPASRCESSGDSIARSMTTADRRRYRLHDSGVVHESPYRSIRSSPFCCSPRRARVRRLQHRRRQGPKTQPPPLAAVPVSPVAADRAADRALHPRHRHADGRGAGRRRRRNRRPRRRDAGRARHAASSQGAELDSAVADRNRRAAQGGRSQRRADRGAARPDRRRRVRRRTRCPRSQNAKASFDARAERVRRASSRCSISASSRSRNTTSGGRRSKRRASSTRRRRTAPRSSIRRCRRRAPAWRSRARRSPTPSSARRSPASSAQRLVSVGDYVTKGMKVADVVRDQSAARAADGAGAVRVGDRRRPAGHVRGRRVSRAAQFEGKVRYVSPALRGRPARADGRSGRAERERRAQAGPVRDRAHRAAGNRRRRCSCPATAVQTTAGTSRVYVVNGDTSKSASSRSAQTLDDSSKSPTGLKAGERVATTNVASSSTASR